MRAAEWGRQRRTPPSRSLFHFLQGSIVPDFTAAKKAEHEWNLLIQLLALSLSTLCSISVQCGTCTVLILHHHSSRQAPERLLRPLVARLQSRPVLSGLWHFPSGHTLLCPPACHYCCIAPCIVWCLAEASSQLHLTHTHTHTLSRRAHWRSPQWFLSTSSYLFYYVRWNYTAGVSCMGACDNSLSAAVIISNGLCFTACFFAPCTQTTAKAYLLSSSTSNTLMTHPSPVSSSATLTLFRTSNSTVPISNPVNRIDVGNLFLFDAPLCFFTLNVLFLLWQCCGCDLVMFRHSDMIQFGLKYLLWSPQTRLEIVLW